MADLVVDPSQVSSIEVDPSQVSAYAAPEKPWIGQPRPESEGFLSSLYHMPVYGLQDIGTGVKHLSQEGTRRQGAHEVFTGAGEAALPAVAAGGVAALPALGGAGLMAYLGNLALAAGGGAAGNAVGQMGSAVMGADPETRQLVGDAGTVVGAGIPASIGANRIGPAVVGALKGAKEGALKKYQMQGGIIPGAIRGAVQAWENGSSIPAPPRPMTGTSDIPASIPQPPSVRLPDVAPTPATPTVDPRATALMNDKMFQKLSPEHQSAALKAFGVEMPAPPGSAAIKPNVNPAEGELAGARIIGSYKTGNPGVSVEANPDMPRQRSVVYRDAQGKPQGYLSFYLNDAQTDVAPPEHGLYPQVYVSPAARRAGVATRLYDAAKQQGFDLSKVSGTETTPAGAAFLNSRAMPVPPGGLPNVESYKASVPQVSIIPEGEHNIIRKVAETNRGNKDMAIARNLKDEGFTAEKLDAMSDADLQDRVKALGYRPSTGKNYSRTWSAFRRDLRSLLD